MPPWKLLIKILSAPQLAMGKYVGLDRRFTTKELGFKKVQENPMYCGFSEGS